MALIEETGEGRENGGYTRLLGDAALGALLSRVHATTIRAGSELEDIVARHARTMTEQELDSFFCNQLCPGTYTIGKPLIKGKLAECLKTRTQPDFVVIVVVESQVYVIELKDGDNFDTKKSAGEVGAARDYASTLERFLATRNVRYKGAQYTVTSRFCCFNQQEHALIVTGLKGKIQEHEAMTGREFCRLISISYDAILEERSASQRRNFSFFLEQMSSIASVSQQLREAIMPTLMSS